MKNKTAKMFLLAVMVAAVFCGCSGEFWHPGEERENNASDSLIPVVGDYFITGLEQAYNGLPCYVTITPKTGKSPGSVMVFYNGSTTAPSEAESYSITFDVAGAHGWYKAQRLIGGTLVISDESLTAAGFLRVYGGTFTIGSPSTEAERWDDEGPQHQVTVNSFYMGKYQVTQAEYEDVMETNPSYFNGSNLPVENVSWYDAVEYCNRLSQREGLTPAYRGSGETLTCDWNANGYRLPTEAEWEYACRAGTTTPFSTGNNITTSQANYNGDYPYNNNATGMYRVAPTPVGSFASNPWGLYDMHGNVWEWCWDWYDNYSSGAQTNPHGYAFGIERVARGGSWYSYGKTLRSAVRSWDPPSDLFIDVGFRLVRR